MGKANPAWKPDDLRGVAAEYALSVAEPADVISFEMLLEEKDHAAVAELSMFEETAARLAHAAPIDRPSPRLRDKLLSSIKEPKAKVLPGFKEEIPGFHVLRAGTGVWMSTPVGGIDSMLLSRDPASDVVTTLIRMAPGASFPRHRHTREEQCWVLQGDVRQVDGEVAMHAGDFVRAMPGTDHSPITTSGGCLLLLVASYKDEMLD